jgi:hypothetical protein
MPEVEIKVPTDPSLPSEQGIAELSQTRFIP